MSFDYTSMYVAWYSGTYVMDILKLTKRVWIIKVSWFSRSAYVVKDYLEP